MGIDSSTQGCKVLIIRPATAEIVYLDTLNYDEDLPRYHTRSGVIPTSRKELSEADPGMWLDALHLLFRRMKKAGVAFKQISAVSVFRSAARSGRLDKRGT